MKILLIKRFLTILFIAFAMIVPSVAMAQSDGGKKKKARTERKIQSKKPTTSKMKKHVTKTWGNEDDPFYIVMGVHIGKTSKQEAQSQGYVIEEKETYSTMTIPSKDGEHYPTYFFNKNDIVNDVSPQVYGIWPSNWEKWGLNKNMSFNDFKSFFENKGWRFTFEKRDESDGGATFTYSAYSPDRSYYFWGFYIYGYDGIKLDKPGYMNSIKLQKTK